MGVAQRIGHFRRTHNILFSLFVFIAIVLIITAALLPLVDLAPPPAVRTVREIRHARGLIAEYIELHGAPATQPNDMIKIGIYGNHDRLEDAWGHQLVARSNEDRTISVISFGRDGKPGGQGDDADIVGTFDPKARNGAWIHDPTNL